MRILGTSAVPLTNVVCADVVIKCNNVEEYNRIKEYYLQNKYKFVSRNCEYYNFCSETNKLVIRLHIADLEQINIYITEITEAVNKIGWKLEDVASKIVAKYGYAQF
jgi:hypothetical protein